jgi:hypothetical protein
MYFPDLVFQDVRAFLDQPGNELVDSWVPDSTAQALAAEDWHSFDDETYKQFGLRTRIVKLFWRETLANIFLYCDSYQDEMEPGVLDAVTKELASRVPLETPKYIPEPVPAYQSESERDARIAAKEMAEEQNLLFNTQFAKWKLGQIEQAEASQLSQNKEANNG